MIDMTLSITLKKHCKSNSEICPISEYMQKIGQSIRIIQVVLFFTMCILLPIGRQNCFQEIVHLLSK